MWDPYEDPEQALATYHRQTQPEAADELLFDFLQDQSEICTVYVDIETTELIDTDSVSIKDMKTSVATALFVYNVSPADQMLLSFYDNASTQRGAPLKFLLHALDHAYRIVTYNGNNFDLLVLSHRDEARLATWRSKSFDAFARLKSEHDRFYKLDTLLQLNGLDAKTAKGSEAPSMWKAWKQTGDQQSLLRLEEYNQRDVTALFQLVSLPSILLPSEDGGVTNPRTEAVHLLPASDPRGLLQNSPAWYDFRVGKIGASSAAAFLRLDFRTTREEAFERLVGTPNANSAANVETEYMARGRREEAKIANTYAKMVPGARLRETGSWPHPTIPWLFASPDRLVLNKKTGQLLGFLEIKSVKTLAKKIPRNHYVQVQLQLACASEEIKFVDYLQQQYGSSKTFGRRIRKDEELINHMIGHLSSVYEAAQPALKGISDAEDLTADDVAAFTREDTLELINLIDESMKLFVS